MKILNIYGHVVFEDSSDTICKCVENAVKAKTNLQSANLRSANLQSANLRSAENVNRHVFDSLLMLRDQVGKIRAYKMVTANGDAPMNGGINYQIGKSYSVDNANIDENESCGAGINLADIPWIIREWKEGYRILVAEFTAKDIAAIPVGSDGKFRVHRCKIVGEKDLVELGLIKKEEVKS